VHFAIETEQGAIGVNDSSGVMIKAGGALLEKRSDDDDALFFGQLLECFRARSGNRFGQSEMVVVFGLAEVLRTK